MQVVAETTAEYIGSGDLAVLATPAMCALMENAAMMAVAPHLEAGQTTVGTALNIEHLRATPVGKTVTATDVTMPKPNLVIELDNGGLRADVTARLVFIDGERIDMSPKEYDLFFYLLSNRNIALSREKLLCEVWGYDFFGDARTLDTHIKLLRKSLGKYSNYIVTLRGVGYRFEEL